MAAHAIGIFAELALHLFEAVENGARMVQQAFAGRRQIDASRVAIEQGRAERGFQVGQPFADGRRRDELPLRRTADAAQLAHRNEELKRGQVDAARKAAFGSGGQEIGKVGWGIAPKDGGVAIFLQWLIFCHRERRWLRSTSAMRRTNRGRKKTGRSPIFLAEQELLLAVCCVFELLAALLDVLAGAGKGIAACQWYGECKSDGDECG